MSTDAITNIQIDLGYIPNERYASVNLGTWSSVSDVDTFFSRFNHNNGYKDGDTKLSLGNYVTIQDGTYNVVWEIAGFDMESNQKAADGTVYDNGYGICLIPYSYITTDHWTSNNSLTGAYKSSAIHNAFLRNYEPRLQNILGSHLIQRNVLLSSSVDSNYHSDAYIWTTAYATLMSAGQMTGNFAANWSKYDDGEANYKLPIFNYKEYKTGSTFWTRNVWGINGSAYYAWSVNGSGIISFNATGGNYGVRPLIYLR